MRRTVSVIVVTTTACNSNCSYCYIPECRRDNRKFGTDGLPILIRNCALGFDHVEFYWHGGEPLLMGVDFYREAISIQKAVARKNRTSFANHVQTNGILLDSRWLDFFSEGDFHVGLSFDAPLEVHSVHRGLSPNYALRAAMLLKKHGFPLGVLCVVSALNVMRGEEIFRYFRDLGVSSYSLLPLKEMPLPHCPRGPTELALAGLYRMTLDLWAGVESDISCIEPLDTILRSLIGESPRGCSFGSPCLKRMATIGPDGHVVPCGSMLTPEFSLGDVLKEPLLAILNERPALQLRRLRARRVIQRCHGCEFLSICRGGCSADSFLHSGVYAGAYPYCQARKDIFRYAREKLAALLPYCS